MINYFEAAATLAQQFPELVESGKFTETQLDTFRDIIANPAIHQRAACAVQAYENALKAFNAVFAATQKPNGPKMFVVQVNDFAKSVTFTEEEAKAECRRMREEHEQQWKGSDCGIPERHIHSYPVKLLV